MNSDLPPAGGPNPASNPSGGPNGTTDTSGTASNPPTPPTPSTGSTAVPAKSFQDFFGWIRSFGIYRPNDGRWAAGVAAGLGRRWGIDPILVRGIFVALAFAGGLGVAAYGIAWLLLPQQDGRIHLQQAIHGRFSAGFVGAVLLSLTLVSDPGWNGDHWFAGPPRFLALVFLIGLIWWMHRHRDESQPLAGHAEPVPADGVDDVPEYGSPEQRASARSERAPSFETPAIPAWTPPVYTPDPARASKRITRVTLGLALLTGAVIGLVWHDSTSWTNPIALIAAAAALAVVATGIIFAGMSGRRSGGLAGVGVLLTFAVLIGAGVHQAGVRSGQNTAFAGEYTWQPTSVAAASRQFNLGLGQGELRLTDPRILQGATAADPLRVSVRVGAGELIVTTPQDVPAEVNVQIGAGQLVGSDGRTIQFDPSNRASNRGVQRTMEVGPPGRPVLVVDVKQGAGEVQLKSAPAIAGPPSITPAPGSSAKTPAPTPSISASTKESSHV